MHIWVRIRDFTLTPYAPRIGVLAKGDSKSVAAWVYHRDPPDADPITGSLQVPGLAEGKYHDVWWDTDEGNIVRKESVAVTAAKPLILTTPPIRGDLALWIVYYAP